MLPAIEIVTPDERDARFDAVAAQFAAPLGRLARALEDEPSRREALLQEIHIVLWRSLADFDERIGPRTWVFRVAHHAVASHQPNTQDVPPVQETIPQAWARWRQSRKQRRLDQAESSTGSTIAVLRGLESFDRELALLYLEGLTAEEAVVVTGMPVEQLAAAYQRMAQLLPTEAREGWQRQANDAVPASRILIHSRIGDLERLRKRQADAILFVVPLVVLMLLVRILTDIRGRWLAVAAFGVFLVQTMISTFLQTWSIRQVRIARSTPASAALGLLDSVSFHRRMLERERDELRRAPGWQGWMVALGASLLLLSFPVEQDSGWAWPLAIFVAMAALGLGHVRANRTKANQLQARIDAMP